MRTSASPPSSGPSRAAGGSPAVPADVGACRLFTTDLAATVLAPQRPARSTDVDSVCAYTANGGRDVVDLGDLPLAPGQTASSALAQEASGQGRSGYRVSRVTVAGRFAAVLEDGRPHVAQLVWVQRSRVLTLTVSPAGTASTTRLRQAAATIGARLG